MTCRVAVIVGCLGGSCTVDEPPEPRVDEVMDTDVEAETDLPEHTDTPPVETLETAIVPRAPPTTLGAGFVDDAAATWVLPGWVRPVTGGEHPSYETLPLMLGDVNEDGVIEVIAGFIERPETDLLLAQTQAFRYDAVGHALNFDLALTHVLQGQSHRPAAGLFDLDGDGHQDIIRISTSHPIYLGRGDGTFDEIFFELPPGFATSPGPAVITPMDVDADGWLDLVLAPSHCFDVGSDELMVAWRTGLRTWALDSDVSPGGRPAQSRAVAPGPPDGGEPLVLSLAGNCDPADPVTGMFAVRGASLQPVDLTPADAVYRGWWGGLPTLASVVPSGGGVSDVDADGRLDVVLVGSGELGMVFGGMGPGPWRDRTARADIRLPVGPSGRVQRPWGAALVDVDQDGAVDLVTVHGPEASDPAESPPPEGPFSPHLWWNDGAGRFHEMSHLAGLDAVVGGRRALAVGDVDGDADPDLLVGGYEAFPALLRNEVSAGNHGLALRLRGSTSNPLGIGAIVQVEVAGLPVQVRVVGGGISPDVIAPPAIFVGLGAATQADMVRVRWPSGHVQEVAGLAAGGTWLVEEPAIITLSRASRHAPADGVSTVRVDVRPRDPAGALRSSASVAVELAAGGGIWSGPVVADAEGWHRTLVAPRSAGVSTVEVSVDGVALGVRPRVWWDGP